VGYIFSSSSSRLCISAHLPSASRYKKGFNILPTLRSRCIISICPSVRRWSIFHIYARIFSFALSYTSTLALVTFLSVSHITIFLDIFWLYVCSVESIESTRYISVLVHISVGIYSTRFLRENHTLLVCTPLQYIDISRCIRAVSIGDIFIGFGFFQDILYIPPVVYILFPDFTKRVRIIFSYSIRFASSLSTIPGYRRRDNKNTDSSGVRVDISDFEKYIRIAADIPYMLFQKYILSRYIRSI
jgi:hypothetical protein